MLCDPRPGNYSNPNPCRSPGLKAKPRFGEATELQRRRGIRGRTQAVMEESSGGGASDPLQGPRASSYKGKSCKGCLYFSSVLKANARSPICFGISRTLPQGGLFFQFALICFIFRCLNLLESD